MPSTPAPWDDKARAGMKQWVEHWKRVGPLLEAQRVTELRALTEAESARIAVELLWPMAPLGSGDDGGGLMPIQVAQRRLADAAHVTAGP